MLQSYRLWRNALSGELWSSRRQRCGFYRFRPNSASGVAFPI